MSSCCILVLFSFCFLFFFSLRFFSINFLLFYSFFYSSFFFVFFVFRVNRSILLPFYSALLRWKASERTERPLPRRNCDSDSSCQQRQRTIYEIFATGRSLCFFSHTLTLTLLFCFLFSSFLCSSVFFSFFSFRSKYT